MTKRTTKAKPRKKRNYRRRRLLTHAPIGKSLGFPRTQRVQLRYACNVDLQDGTGGVLDLHAFRANGIYDPDVTGVGHQPLGRDQWETFYNHYRVVESRITVQGGTQIQVANQKPAVIGIYLSDDLTVPVKWTELVEAGRGSYMLDNNLNTEIRTLRCVYKQSAFFKGQGVNQSQLGAAMNADPMEQCYYILYMQAADQSSLATLRSFKVIIDYLVEFSEPKDLLES